MGTFYFSEPTATVFRGRPDRKPRQHRGLDRPELPRGSDPEAGEHLPCQHPKGPEAGTRCVRGAEGHRRTPGLHRPGAGYVARGLGGMGTRGGDAILNKVREPRGERPPYSGFPGISTWKLCCSSRPLRLCGKSNYKPSLP